MADRQGVRVRIEPGRAMADYTFELPRNPLGDYFNLSLVAVASGGRLAVDSITFGDRRLPGWILLPIVGAVDALRITSYNVCYTKLLRTASRAQSAATSAA